MEETDTRGGGLGKSFSLKNDAVKKRATEETEKSSMPDKMTQVGDDRVSREEMTVAVVFASHGLFSLSI